MPVCGVRRDGVGLRRTPFWAGWVHPRIGVPLMVGGVVGSGLRCFAGLTCGLPSSGWGSSVRGCVRLAHRGGVGFLFDMLGGGWCGFDFWSGSE